MGGSDGLMGTGPLSDVHSGGLVDNTISVLPPTMLEPSKGGFFFESAKMTPMGD